MHCDVLCVADHLAEAGGDRMIWFYSGTNGSGKSLHVARDIYNRLRRRGKHNGVIATFDINTARIKPCNGIFTKVSIYDLSPAMLVSYAFKHHVLDGPVNVVEGQTLVVIDEAQRIFNPRDYDKNGRREWLDWFPEHRKYGFNFILISPFDKMIDRQIRSLFEYHVVHRKVNNFGVIGLLLSLVRIRLFFAISYWSGTKQKCGVERFMASKRYTRIYNTFQRFGKDGDPLAVAGGAAAPVGGPATAAGGFPSADELTETQWQLRLLSVLRVIRDQRAAEPISPTMSKQVYYKRREQGWARKKRESA